LSTLNKHCSRNSGRVTGYCQSLPGRATLVERPWVVLLPAEESSGSAFDFTTVGLHGVRTDFRRSVLRVSTGMLLAQAEREELLRRSLTE